MNYRVFKITIIGFLILSFATGSFLAIQWMKRNSKNALPQKIALEQIKNLMPLGEKALSFEQCEDSRIFLMPHHLIVRSVIETMYQTIKTAATNNATFNKGTSEKRDFENENAKIRLQTLHSSLFDEKTTNTMPLERF
ncbi:hypothetical protein HYV57_01770 [Candidatus Peregrinibacteria bacterium]|nr:hypothetical protein [Candidatus Peregrinibacteria bacterium]